MRYLLIGGTGSLGKALIPAILEQDHRAHIAVLSREEIKQVNIKKQYPGIECIIGDIKDIDSLRPHIQRFDAVFNLAALKHVDICELNPKECYKTNLIGAANVVDLCELADNVRYCVLSSTDKAVLPINMYGSCKKSAEIYYRHMNDVGDGDTLYNVFRWGNVVGSRGSVVHAFAKTLKEEAKVYVTDERMSRFWIDIRDVAKFMLGNFKRPPQGTDAHIPPLKSARVVDLAEAVADVLDIQEYEVKYTGIRPGEKIHECLYTSHDFCLTSENCGKYEFEELCDLVYGCLHA